MALKPPELMQIEVPVAYFYMCVVYLNYVYYVKAAEEMLSMWYFGTLYVVIYSLNLRLANKCMSLETLPIRIIDIMRITKFVYLLLPM